MKRVCALLFVASGIGPALAQSQDSNANQVIQDDEGAVLLLNKTEHESSSNLNSRSPSDIKVDASGKPPAEWAACPEGMSHLAGVGCVPNPSVEGSENLVGPTSEERVRAAEARAAKAEKLLAEYQAHHGSEIFATGSATGGATGGATDGATGSATGLAIGGATGSTGGEAVVSESASDPEFDAMWASQTPSKQYKDGNHTIMQSDPQTEAYNWNGTYTGVNTAKEPLPEGAAELPKPDQKCCRICHGCKDEDRDENGDCLEEFQPCETVCGEKCEMAQPPKVTTAAPEMKSHVDQVTFDASNVIITDEMKSEVAKTPLSERVQKISQLLRSAARKANNRGRQTIVEDNDKEAASTDEEVASTN